MAATCAVVALLCPSSASASLLWSKPAQLTPLYAASPQALMDERGQVLLTWNQRKGYGPDRGIFSYRWRAPDGKWSGTRTLDDVRTDYDAKVQMTPRGEALLAFGSRESEPVYAVADSGGAFSKPKRLGDAGETGTVDLATDDAGNAVATWLRRDGAIRVATRRAGEDFAPASTLEVLTRLQLQQSPMPAPSASVNAAGAAAVVWQAGHAEGADGKWYIRHRLAYRAPGGNFGAPENVPLSEGQWSGFDQGLIVSETGEVVLTMTSALVVSQSGTSYAVRQPTGAWSEPRELGQLGYVTNVFAEPGGAVSFVVGRIGGGYYSNGEKHGDTNRYVDFATHRPDSGLDGPRQISVADGTSPDASMNQRGDILAAWTVGGDGDASSQRIAVSERILGTVFAPEIVLSKPGVWPPQVSLNAGRNAAVVWNGDDEPGGEFTAAAWGSFRSDPQLPPLPLPPVIDIGDPLDPLLDEDGISVPIRCDQACTVQPEGLLLDGPGTGARAKKAGKVRVAKGKRGRVRLRFDSKARAAAREALAAGRKPWVSVSVRAKGKSPRTVRASRRVKLRR